jgi:hypothetical protein
MLGRADGFGQRLFGQVSCLISHPAIVRDGPMWPRSHYSPERAPCGDG